MTSLKELTSNDFSIGDIRFRVSKLKGMAGFELLEKIRTALGQEALDNTFASENEAEVGTSVIGLICSIPTKNVLDILDSCKECIDVRLPSSDRYLPMREVEALLNEVIEPVDYYELIARAIAVNFTKSLRDLLHRHGLAVGAV